MVRVVGRREALRPPTGIVGPPDLDDVGSIAAGCDVEVGHAKMGS